MDDGLHAPRSLAPSKVGLSAVLPSSNPVRLALVCRSFHSQSQGAIAGSRDCGSWQQIPLIDKPCQGFEEEKKEKR